MSSELASFSYSFSNYIFCISKYDWSKLAESVLWCYFKQGFNGYVNNSGRFYSMIHSYSRVEDR